MLVPFSAKALDSALSAGEPGSRAPLNNGNRAQRSPEAFRARRVAQVMAVTLGKRRKRMAAPLLWTLQGPPCGAFRQTRTRRCHFSTGNQPAFKAAP